MTLKDAQLYDLFHISHEFLYLKQVKGASLVYQNTHAAVAVKHQHVVKGALLELQNPSKFILERAETLQIAKSSEYGGRVELAKSKDPGHS